MSLSTTIKSIQDIMRKDDGVDGDAQRIGQLTWMLFLKVYDQREEEWEDDAADAGKKFRSVMPEGCRWRDWAKDKNGLPSIPGNELIEYVNSVVFPQLKDLPVTRDPRAKVVRDVFADANNYMKSGPLMLGVIQKLDEAINFHNQGNRDELGKLYEQILSDLRGAGNAGEFYTPRAVTEFMVRAVNPRLKKREVVFDPACGTGGFLTATIEHFRNQLTKRSSAEDRAAIETCIRGIEKKQLPHLLCVTNLLLHGIDIPSQVEHTNTLGKAWNDWTHSARVDCVITNPPFGGMEDDNVGSNFPADIKTRETADMFMSLITRKLLKKNGRAAVVLPDGTLFGDGVKAVIKRKLLEDCNLHTIIRLPNGVFAPYTGIKTNLLFFTHGKPTGTIWFYEHRYPEGQKSYSKTRPMRLDELLPILDWWGKEKDGFADRIETEQAWRVDFAAIKADAEARAQPHWDKAEALKNEASAMNETLKDLRSQIRAQSNSLAPPSRGGEDRREGANRAGESETLKDLRSQARARTNSTNSLAPTSRGGEGRGEGADRAGEMETIRMKLAELEANYESLLAQSRNEQSAGDQIYWPIFNLDIKNPNTVESGPGDPDKLLQQLRLIRHSTQQTIDELKQELAAALSGGDE